MKRRALLLPWKRYSEAFWSWFDTIVNISLLRVEIQVIYIYLVYKAHTDDIIQRYNDNTSSTATSPQVLLRHFASPPEIPDYSDHDWRWQIFKYSLLKFNPASRNVKATVSYGSQNPVVKAVQDERKHGALTIQTISVGFPILCLIITLNYEEKWHTCHDLVFILLLIRENREISHEHLIMTKPW